MATKRYWVDARKVGPYGGQQLQVEASVSGRSATISWRPGRQTFRVRLYGPGLDAINSNGGRDLIFHSMDLGRCRYGARLWVRDGGRAFADFWNSPPCPPCRACQDETDGDPR